MISHSKQLNKENGLTLTHYKEPLIKVKGGYGYYGALMATMDGKKVQCHICGKLFKELNMHVRQAHSMSSKKYKENYQLARTTSLISEEARQERKMRTLKWLASLSDEQRSKMYKEAADRLRKMWREGKYKSFQFNIRLETKNKRGTCPDQLLQVIKEVSEKVGGIPTLRDLIRETGGERYKHLIFTTFGSWKNALKMLNMSPVSQDYDKQIKKRRRYSDNELLDFLSIYAQENGKIPTATDYKRGLIPNESLYKRRFGSLDQAREIAGVYKIIPKSSLRGYVIHGRS